MLLASLFRYLASPCPRPRAQRRRGQPAHARSTGSPLVLQCLESRVVPSFIAATNYNVGKGPGSVAIADFNGDGVQDLVVANMTNACDSCASDVSILLGNGDGTFAAAHNFMAGVGPSSVAVGDFNGDGIPDLAVVNSASYGGSSSLSILLGNGDGTFEAPQNFNAGPNPWSVAIGDFNGDGIQDVAVTGRSGVSVLLGTGDGTFRPAVTYTTGSGPRSVAVGDFDGDGTADLAVGNIDSHNVSVLLGDGDGTFRPAVNYAGGTPMSLAVGDFNGDGVPDLAFAGGGAGVLLGTGDGTFRNGGGAAAALDATSVAVGDFNGDGKLDLVTGGGRCDLESCTDTAVTIAQGNGDGTFHGNVGHFSTGVLINSVAVADFDGDGVPDLAAAAGFTILGQFNPGSTVTVLKGRGDGTVQAAPAVNTNDPGHGPYGVVVGDFNGDGIPDLATTDIRNNVVWVRLGVGGGTFQPRTAYRAGVRPQAVVLGDFNGDGFPDLAVADGGGGVSVLLDNGDGTFQYPLTFTTGLETDSLVVGDFNGDGIQDLAVANDVSSGTVSVLLGTGDGTFRPAVNYAVGSYPFTPTVGDFNGDGIQDLAVTNDAGVSVLLGHGDGTFGPAVNYTMGRAPARVAAGDFNGDGIDDLAVTSADLGRNSSVSVLLGNGDGTFRPANSYTIGGQYAYGVVVADFNGDGLPDLAVMFDWGVHVLLGNGDGSFRNTPFSFAAGNDHLPLVSQPLLVGDFNGDGLPDLAVANCLSNDVSFLLNDGNWPAAPSSAPDRRTGQGNHCHAVASLSRLVPALPLTASKLPASVDVSPAAQQEPWMPAVVGDSLSAIQPPDGSVGPVARRSLVHYDASSTMPWHPRINDLDLPEEVPASQAWELV